MDVLRDHLRRCAAAYPDRTAYVDGSRSCTWAQLDRRASFLAGALQELGVRHGTVVAYLGGDHLELVEHWFACLKLGAVRTGINYRYGTRETAHILTDSQTRVMIAESRLVTGDLRRASADAGATLVAIQGGDPVDADHGYEELLSRASLPDLAPITASDLAAISYTSGTTGMPKGALFTQHGVREASMWTVINAGLRHEDVWYNAAPCSGAPLIFACSNVVNGMTCVLPGRAFDATTFLDQAREWSVTTGIFVPTQLIQILAAMTATGIHPSTFRQVCYGSSPAPESLIRDVQRAFGCELQQWYSSTELTAAPAMILRNSEHHAEADPSALRSCGVPQPHVDIAIRDPDGGGVGEVWIRPSNPFAGYRNLPVETAEVLSEDWVRPGDIGRMDEDGRLFLLDRKNFLIISGGFNVYPNVVENVVAEMPAVKEVIVVGAPHPYWGEAVVALAVKHPDTSLEAEDVITWCRERLGAWEIPKFVEFAEQLPRNAAAKPDKAAVRDRYRDHPEQLPWNA